MTETTQEHVTHEKMDVDHEKTEAPITEKPETTETTETTEKKKKNQK